MAETSPQTGGSGRRLGAAVGMACLLAFGPSMGTENHSALEQDPTTDVHVVSRHSDAAAVELPTSPVRRLTRYEYANSLRDLFGIEIPFTEELPADGRVGGFDNNGDAMSLSPLLLENYLRVARKVGDLIMGTGSASVETRVFPVVASISDTWVEGLPMGTRGGMRIDHYFPHGGDYEVRAILDIVYGTSTRFSRLFGFTPEEGASLFRKQLRLTAGMHTIFVTFPGEYAAQEGAVGNLDNYFTGGAGLGGPLDVHGSAFRPTIEFWLDGDKVESFEIRGPRANQAVFESTRGPPALQRVEIKGPFNPILNVATPARQKLLTCTPRFSWQERRCASKILSSVARRAYRRDITEQDMAPVLAAFTRKRATADFDQAIGMGLVSILVSPDFLFRIEHEPPGAKPGQTFRISDYELATRLSYFIWSCIPDDELLEHARQGRLNGDELKQQVRRLLSDRRADALVDNFAMQWLGLIGPDVSRPDSDFFAEFNEELEQAIRQETRLFVRALLRDNRSILEAVSSDYAFLNERLAKHYGIEGVRGNAFRRVKLNGSENRGGLIGQASVLIASSHATQTSPILRGKWVLTNLLNSPPPPPPTGVPPLDTQPADDGRILTTREQIERHRSSPVCASCHSKMDPYGIALESYDALGRWRTEENGAPIDASTVLRGKKFSGPVGLKQVLLERSGEFTAATVSQLLTYALGRKLEKSDETSVRRALQALEPEFGFADAIMEIVNDPVFQMRQVPPPVDSD